MVLLFIGAIKKLVKGATFLNNFLATFIYILINHHIVNHIILGNKFQVIKRKKTEYLDNLKCTLKSNLF